MYLELVRSSVSLFGSPLRPVSVPGAKLTRLVAGCDPLLKHEKSDDPNKSDHDVQLTVVDLDLFVASARWLDLLLMG